MNQWLDILGDEVLAMMAGDSATKPPFLQARSASQVQSILGASPSALFQYEDASSTVSTDLIGGTMTLTATGGADRIASAVMGNAARVANNSTQYWGSSSTSDLEVTTGAFAIAGVMTIPTAPAAEQWAWLKYQNPARGYGIAILATGHLNFYTFEPAGTAATIAVNHVGSTAFGFIVGRSVTDLKLYATTTLGTGETAIGAATSLTSVSRVAAPGRHQVDAGAGNVAGTLLDGWAFFAGAQAEALLANRATAVGKLVR